MHAVETRSLGPNNRSRKVSAGEFAGGTLYVGSRIVKPGIVGALDLAAREVTANYEVLESGRGPMAIWGLQSMPDGAVYVALSNEGQLHRVDPEAGTVSLAADLPGASFVWDLDAVPGEDALFAATKPESRVFAYDTGTDALERLGSAASDQEYARSVAVTAETVYVGVGSRAHLVAVDRETGAREEILPGKLADCSFVRELQVAGDHLVAGVGNAPGAHLLVMDRTDHGDYRVVETGPDPGDGSVDAVTVDPGGAAYFCDDALRRYDLETGEITRLADATAADIFYAGDRVIGAGLPA